jgi:hypothetical protein
VLCKAKERISQVSPQQKNAWYGGTRSQGSQRRNKLQTTIRSRTINEKTLEDVLSAPGTRRLHGSGI